MAKTASLNIRIDPETKKNAEELYAKFGITITDAVNMFLRQSLMEGGLPFKPKKPRYNAETIAALEESEEILAVLRAGGDTLANGRKIKRYASTEEMFADIMAEDDDDVR